MLPGNKHNEIQSSTKDQREMNLIRNFKNAPLYQTQKLRPENCSTISISEDFDPL